MSIRCTTLALFAAACFALNAATSNAATKTWDGHNRVNLVWDTSTPNWNPGGVAFNNGDTAHFTNHPTALGRQTITIAAGGVSPAAITMAYWQAEPGSYEFTGGDITGTGTFSMTSDGVLHLARSFSFSGGASISHRSASVEFEPTTGGAHHFGTGAITLSGGWTGGGQFKFNPTVAATNDNNFVVTGDGGSLTGNANASWSGNLSLETTVGLVGSQMWSGLTIHLANDNGNIRFERFTSGSLPRFDGNVQGAAFDVKFGDKLTGGTPTDYEIVIDNNSTFNVNNLILDSLATVLVVQGTDSQTVFDDVNGKIVLQNNSILATTQGGTNNYNSYTGTYYVENDYEIHSGNFTRIVASNILVQDGGSVSGDGRLHAHGGGVTVNDGTLAPGLSIGTLNVTGHLTLTPDAMLEFELGAPGISDTIAVAGNLTLDGTLDLTQLEPLAENTLHSFTLLTYTGSLTNNGLNLILPEFATGFLDFSTAGQVKLNMLLSVPEPSTGLLLVGGLVAFRRCRRPRARR